MRSSPQASPPYSEPIFGMWVWQPQYISDVSEQDRLIAFCLQHGMNRLLIQVQFDPESVQQGKPQLAFPDRMREFLAKANQAGISVEALDGEQGMGLAVNHERSLQLLEAILSFTKTLAPSDRFVGVHYDIEPYTLPQWRTAQRDAVMYEYLEFHSLARQMLHEQSPPMLLSASIPFWYDVKTSQDDHCLVEYQGYEKNFHEHIQDLTDYIAIMSYRREAQGDNSITSVVTSEIDYAQRIGRYACAGIETIRLDDTPHITFYGAHPDEFRATLQTVQQILAFHEGYGGVFVHDYRGLRDLLSPNFARAD